MPVWIFSALEGQQGYTDSDAFTADMFFGHFNDSGTEIDIIPGNYTYKYYSDSQKIELIDPLNNRVGGLKDVANLFADNQILFDNGVNLQHFNPDRDIHQATYSAHIGGYNIRADASKNTFNTTWQKQPGLSGALNGYKTSFAETISNPENVSLSPAFLHSLVGIKGGNYSLESSYDRASQPGYILHVVHLYHEDDIIGECTRRYYDEFHATQPGQMPEEDLNYFNDPNTPLFTYNFGNLEFALGYAELDIGNLDSHLFNRQDNQFYIDTPLTQTQKLGLQVGERQQDVIALEPPVTTAAALGLRNHLDNPLTRSLGIYSILPGHSTLLGDATPGSVTLDDKREHIQHAQYLIKEAIKGLSEVQGNLGKQQSHLSHYVDRISVTAINMQASTDIMAVADIQKEVAKLSKFEAMTQASMIGQSHASDLFTRVIQSLMR